MCDRAKSLWMSSREEWNNDGNQRQDLTRINHDHDDDADLFR